MMIVRELGDSSLTMGDIRYFLPLHQEDIRQMFLLPSPHDQRQYELLDFGAFCCGLVPGRFTVNVSCITLWGEGPPGKMNNLGEQRPESG